MSNCYGLPMFKAQGLPRNSPSLGKVDLKGLEREPLRYCKYDGKVTFKEKQSSRSVRNLLQ